MKKPEQKSQDRNHWRKAS